MQWAPLLFWAIGQLLPIPPLSHIPHSRILARCNRWRPARFCGIRPVGVIRPLLDLPYFGNRSAEKQKSRHFATFLRLGTLFCSSKAEIGCRTADYLRFCTVIRDRGSPQQFLIAKKLQFEPFFCFQSSRNGFRVVSEECAAQVRRCRMIRVRCKFDVAGMTRQWSGHDAAG